MKNINILFYTIEDLCSGLFKSQVLTLARYLSIQKNVFSVTILSINRAWHFRLHSQELISYRKDPSNRFIKFRYLPLLPPLRHAVGSRLYSKAVTWWLAIILRIMYRDRYNVINARSYWPAAAANILRRAPVLFDLRSLWVHENISSGNLNHPSTSSNYWFGLEKYCVMNSAVSTCVSSAMIKYINHTYKKHAELIPISADPAVFRYDLQFRKDIRNKYNLNDKIVFVYSGSLGQSNINKNYLIKLLKLIVKIENAYVLFLTNEQANKINELMCLINSKKSSYKIVSSRYEELGKWLSAADVGIHALPPQKDSDTRLGTKVVEYWMMGLPVIVNTHVGAAVQYIEKHNLGCVVDLGIKSEINLVELLSKNRNEINNLAIRYFSVKVCAEKYHHLVSKISSHTDR